MQSDNNPFNFPVSAPQSHTDDSSTDFAKYVAPVDAADVCALWLPTNVRDPLTTTHLLSVPVGKPRDFFRVHPSEDYVRVVEVYKHKTEASPDETTFLIGPEMRGRIPEARQAVMLTCVDRLGNARLWPIPQPRNNERDNEAWSSARIAARQAREKWLKILWAGRAYVVREASHGYAPEPSWAKLPSFPELTVTAFGRHGVIRNEDHPIYRELFGVPAKSAVGSTDDVL